jgi:dipeptidase E
MKLVLYAGGHYADNPELNRACLELARVKKPRITFIPSSSDGGPEDFQEFVDCFDDLGITDYVYFPVDLPFTELLAGMALSSDVIFLGGGNTFSFLRSLRAGKLLGRLKQASERGAVLAGLSAGAILLTPNISTASFPAFDSDDNAVQIKNWQALGLTPFEFFPHFVNSERYRRALTAHSRRVVHPVVGSGDGGGVVYTRRELRLVGSFQIFMRGKSVPLLKSFRREEAQKHTQGDESGTQPSTAAPAP